jgi:hypothetical protein
LPELTSERWRTLTDAYGPAEPVPSLLAQLSSFPAETPSRSDPWFSLWSRLCHQGDVYPASFAAVPHIIGAAARAPERTTFSYFLLPAAIELARHRRHAEVPGDIYPDYRHALDGIPALAAAAASRAWDAAFCQSVLAAIAASRAHYDIASLLVDVETSSISEVLEWYSSR